MRSEALSLQAWGTFVPHVDNVKSVGRGGPGELAQGGDGENEFSPSLVNTIL